MNWVLIIFAVKFCLCDVIEGDTDDVSSEANNPANDHQYSDTLGWNTGYDDVRCTTTGDIIEARRFLCPAHCRCSPLDGHKVLTTLTVNCYGTKFNRSTSLKFNEELTQLLSQCVSELTQLTITNTPLTTVPEIVCRLSKIQSLYLDSNQLASLPSNCFTRVRNLTSFSANSNRVTSLQVGCRLS